LSLAQSAVMFLLLLAPTALMGGTLPVLVGVTGIGERQAGGRIGWLYGLNTLGAMVGVLFSGMYAIGAIGEWRTVCVGVMINLSVALAAMVLSIRSPGNRPADQAPPPARPPAAPGMAPQRQILLAYGCSGFVAIAYEVVWTRMFQIQLGTSIYSFSMMLAYYLLGVGIGSLAGARWPLLTKRPVTVLVVSQALIGLLGLGGMFLFTAFMPASCSWSLRLGNLLLMPLLLVTPITLLLGTILPAVGTLYVRGEATAAADVGRLYAANTIGCIAGSLITGFVLIGLLGTRGMMIALAGANVALAWAIARGTGWARRPARWITLGAITAAAAILAVTVPDPFMNALSKSVRALWGVDIGRVTMYANHEGTAATTTAFAVGDKPGGKQLWINGIGMTHLCTETKIMAHLPLVMHPHPRDALVICMGMGTALRSAWKHHDVRCDVVEIVPDVYRCFRFFHRDAPQILADPRVRHFADDGRNFLLMRPAPYDVITIDPAPPMYSAGTVNLYTEEFFRLCRDHLRPGGIICLWVQPDRFSEVRMIMRSFSGVFPQALVWGGPTYPGIYLTGFNGTVAVHPERFRAADGDTALISDLTEWDMAVPRPSAILDLLVLDQGQLQDFVQGARTLTDDLPYTEFPLWRGRADSTYRWDLNALGLLSWRMRNYPPR